MTLVTCRNAVTCSQIHADARGPRSTSGQAVESTKRITLDLEAEATLYKFAVIFLLAHKAAWTKLAKWLRCMNRLVYPLSIHSR